MPSNVICAIGQPRTRVVRPRFVAQSDSTHAEQVVAVRAGAVDGQDIVQSDADQERRPLRINYKTLADGSQARVVFIA